MHEVRLSSTIPISRKKLFGCSCPHSTRKKLANGLSHQRWSWRHRWRMWWSRIEIRWQTGRAVLGEPAERPIRTASPCSATSCWRWTEDYSGFESWISGQLTANWYFYVSSLTSWLVLPNSWRPAAAKHQRDYHGESILLAGDPWSPSSSNYASSPFSLCIGSRVHLEYHHEGSKRFWPWSRLLVW